MVSVGGMIAAWPGAYLPVAALSMVQDVRRESVAAKRVAQNRRAFLLVGGHDFAAQLA
jgi:hypothetical protein